MVSHLSYWETRCAEKSFLQHSAHQSCSVKNEGLCTLSLSHLIFPHTP